MFDVTHHVRAGPSGSLNPPNSLLLGSQFTRLAWRLGRPPVLLPSYLLTSTWACFPICLLDMSSSTSSPSPPAGNQKPEDWVAGPWDKAQG